MHVWASAQQLLSLRSCTASGQGDIALSKDDGGPAEMSVHPTRRMRTSGACAAWHAFSSILRQPYISLPLIHFAHGCSPSPVVATAEKRYGLSTLCKESAHRF